jgi:biotin synthase
MSIETISRWQALAERALAGEAPDRAEALAMLEAPDLELLEMLAAAYRVRSHYYGNLVKLNFLINAKSGLCPEDCFYCSQSKISTAEIKRYPLMTRDQILEQAERAVANKASTCCIVISGRRPTGRELNHVAGAVEEIKSRHPDLKICACLGLLSEQEARRLHEAGVERYNHNLNTAEDLYGDICTTHTFEDRKATVEAVRAGGISPCSGIIVGMGETNEQLVDVAFALREIGAESIPVNFLLPIEGTPLAASPQALNPRACLKVLCMVRMICPDREIRVSAGREVHLRSLQPLSLYAANALFVADYLTTPGQASELDWQMVEDLGFEIEPLGTPIGPIEGREARGEGRAEFLVPENPLAGA